MVNIFNANNVHIYIYIHKICIFCQMKHGWSVGIGEETFPRLHFFHFLGFSLTF